MRRHQNVGAEHNYADENKQDARQKTVVERYRQVVCACNKLRPFHKTAEALEAAVYAYIKEDGSYENVRLPPNRTFVSLCNDQTNISPHADSEIEQMMKNKLITEDQYVGIDRDPLKKFMDNNRTMYERAMWFDGEWVQVFHANAHILNPGIVFFDTLYILENKRLWQDVITTMRACPPQTYFVVNAAAECLPRGRSAVFDFGEESKMLFDGLPYSERSRWIDPYFDLFKYKSKKTTMCSFCLWKEF